MKKSLTRSSIISNLEHILNNSSPVLVRLYILHCNDRVILFINEILVNVSKGTLTATSHQATSLLQYKVEIDSLFNLIKPSSNTKKRSSSSSPSSKSIIVPKKSITRQRAILCTAKGVKLLKLLLGLVVVKPSSVDNLLSFE